MKLWRVLLEKPIWLASTPEQKTILITILLMANREGGEWEWGGQKFAVKPGQFVTSLEAIRSKCGHGVSIKNVRTALARFEKLGFLTMETAKAGRLITITNWPIYQGKSGKDDAEEPEKRQTGGKGTGKATGIEDGKETGKADNQVYQGERPDPGKATGIGDGKAAERELATNKNKEEAEEEEILSSPPAQTASKTAKRKRKSDTDPRVKPVIDYFCKKFLEATGMPYVTDWGKDGALIKGLPREYTMEILCQLIDRFFAEKDRWVWEEAGPTIGVFKTRLPQLVAKHGLKKGGAACRETEDAEAIIARLYQQTGQKPAL